MRYVIVGSSAGAIGCITGIRKVDPDGEIKVISYEKECYSKPMIADILVGVPEEKLIYRDEGYFRENGAERILGRAVRIDPSRKEVILESGDAVGYDRLLISTGGIPFVPPIEGVDKEGVFTFTELESARALKSYIEENGVQSAVVIGSGFIGLEVAYFLAEKGIQVTVVELLDRVLARALDPRGSEIVEGMLKEKGIRFIFKNTVEKILGKEKVSGVVLRDRRIIETQVVVVAIGVRPNTSLAETAKVKVERGIVVDDRMATSVENIFAVGDCVECLDITDGKRKPIPLFPLAFEQGFIAGVNMAGGEIRYHGGFPMNSLKFLEKPVLNAGIIEPDSSCEVLVEDRFAKKGYYRKVVLREGRLVGFVAVGRIERAGILTNLIRQRIDVSEIKERLLSPDFGLADLPLWWRKEKLVEDRTSYEDWRSLE